MRLRAGAQGTPVVVPPDEYLRMPQPRSDDLGIA
jgi:hypothetical protein